MAEAPTGAEPRRLSALRELAAVLPSFAPLLSRLPSLPASAALATALNLLFEPGDEGLAALRGATLTIRVTDAGLRFHLAHDARGFVARPWSRRADVTISACARDFVALALREQDPDTLFFARRLLVEGDTERGLVLKNRLDALEADALHRPPPRLLALLGAIATTLALPFSPAPPPPNRRARPPSRC